MITLFLPVLVLLAAVVCLWIRLTSRGPVLFRQERVGYLGRPFKLYKFRSMCYNVSSERHEQHFGTLAESGLPMTKLDSLGDGRLVPGGRFLRSIGFDELPQLLNVIRGEMSLVGPRPSLSGELIHFSASDRERWATLPGLTGYWQVNGKNRLTFEEMVALDIHYIRNRSLWLDLVVLLRTPVALARQLCEFGKAVLSERSRSRSNGARGKKVRLRTKVSARQRTSR